MAKRVKRIVCLGGGTGQAQVLRGLRDGPVRLTAIVGVTDNGGHSGELRKIFGIPQVGDLRTCLAALCPEGSLWAGLLDARFRRGSLDGTSLGNLILASMVESSGSLSKAADLLSRQLNLRHRVLPSSDVSGDVCARLEGGRTIRGEWEIMLRRPRRRILRVFHEPPLQANPECLKEIEAADLAVFCPGSLFTGILTCLLIPGIRSALQSSRARKVQICNLMTQPGQTDGFGAREHLETLARYLGRLPDFFILNTGRPPASVLRRYGEAGAGMVKDDLSDPEGVQVIRADLLESLSGDLRPYARGGEGRFRVRPHFIRHDPRRLSRLLAGLLGS